MILWSLLTTGAAQDAAAAEELRARLAAVLADPRYGTGLHLLQVGPQPPAPVLAPAG
jgi:hypothetical protein